jgi:N-acetylglucosamine kinase-like BadF-type ATPase
MSDLASKTFDSVHSMRQIRDRLSAEIADMSCDELIHWLRAHHYSDPVLQRLAEKAAQHADPAARPPAGR